VDKGGLPYILHPLAVMLSLPASDVEARIVAVLHDVVEDTETTLEKLSEWMPDHLLAAVDAMSKRKGESNRAYWTRCKANAIAARVKVADMAHNSSPDRLACLSYEEQEYLSKKYEEALAFFVK
jgi:(p)ppGpp synthase/HD superfamily hydrolase